MTRKDIDAIANEKKAIMVELLNAMTGCTYHQGYSIVTQSTVYKELKEDNRFTIYESPQANLDDIGRELRAKGDKLGNVITAENIIKATLKLRNKYLQSQKETVNIRRIK